MTLEEVSEVLDYLNQNPTSDEILAAVHQVKPKSSVRNPKEVGEEMLKDFSSLPDFGMTPSEMPEDFRESIRFAEELQAKIFKERNDH